MPHEPHELIAIAAELAAEVGIDPFTWKIGVCTSCPGKERCGTKEVLFYSDSVLHTLNIPTPSTLDCLFIALHEIGHVHFQHINAIRNQEREASYWAKEQMELRGLVVSPELWMKAQGFWLSYEKKWDARVLIPDIDLHEMVMRQLLRRDHL